jgi:SAM-dependent methyltransferase
MAITDFNDDKSAGAKSFSNIESWDGRYKAGTHRSVWPWSDLVSLCERHVFSDIRKGSDLNILEIGCGYGANIPYLLSTGGRYFGIEGSATAIDELMKNFSLPPDQFACADFTRSLCFDKSFDLIVDRGSITCNSDASIRRCIDLIHSRLRIGGYFSGITWFSKAHSEYQRGDKLDGNPQTRTGYVDGPFANTGTVHFSDEQNLRDLLTNFEIVWMEHKVSQEIVPDNSYVNASYNFVARKT